NVSEAGVLDGYTADKGYFDVVFEAAGQSSTIPVALNVTRPRGTVVLVGQGATAELQDSSVVGKEIELSGSSRSAGEFKLAVDLINTGRVDVTSLLSDVLPLGDAVAAFELAGDKSRSMKVQIDFN